MSGYRQHSYDPNAYEQPIPLRPFNWVQWTGVVFQAAGLALVALWVAGKAGWIPAWVGSSLPAAPLVIVGLALINSRRAEAHDPAPELAAARRRWLVITLAICAVILGAAFVIEFSGA